MEPQDTSSFYKLLFDNANDGILLANLETQKFYIGNKTICKMLGYSKEEIENLEVADIHPEKDLPFVMEQFKRQSSGKLGENILAKDMQVKRKDGSVFYADISASRVKFAGRIYLLGIFRDVTEQRQTKKDLEEAKIAARNVAEDLQIEKENFARAKVLDEAMLLSIGDGLIATGKDGNVMLVNKATKKMLGFKEEELLGKKWTDIVPLVTEKGAIPPEERLIQVALKSDRTTTTTTTYYYVRRDKTKFPVAITASPIILDKKIIGAIVVFRDITEQIKLSKLESEFISVASHQLRTPMMGIQWVAERLLKKEKLSKKGVEYLGDIHDSIKRLTRLVDLLLNVSRIEEGKVSISPQSLEAVGLIKDYLEENEPLRVKKNLSFDFKKHPEKLQIVTDGSALRNIIQILVSNSIEYTLEGGKIEVILEKPDSIFRLIVRDNGIGIPKKEQSTIFDKFVRGSNAQLVKTDGTGLGLYIAKQAVDLLGGKIWLESEINKGSAFYVELPIEVKKKAGQKTFA